MNESEKHPWKRLREFIGFGRKQQDGAGFTAGGNQRKLKEQH